MVGCNRSADTTTPIPPVSSEQNTPEPTPAVSDNTEEQVKPEPTSSVDPIPEVQPSETPETEKQPDPTPEVSNTPEPEQTTEPTPSVEPTPAPEVTPEPTPSVTPEPEPSPESTPSTQPEVAEPTPSPEPIPEVTYTPTPTPEPESTPTVEPEVAGSITIYAGQPLTQRNAKAGDVFVKKDGTKVVLSCFVGFVSGLNRWSCDYSNKFCLKSIYFFCIIRKREGVEMYIDTNIIISVSDANQNFSRAARIADEYGQAVLFKNNRPRYLLIDLEKSPSIEMTDDEKIDFVAARILKKHKDAFIELAK